MLHHTTSHHTIFDVVQGDRPRYPVQISNGLLAPNPPSSLPPHRAIRHALLHRLTVYRIERHLALLAPRYYAPMALRPIDVNYVPGNSIRPTTP